ncbi:hypothetical protein OG21DRAFT_1314454 [Imleria badia]|nr:hypothetical protein OG21DRAFT_1314454 [Imleria badia]
MYDELYQSQIIPDSFDEFLSQLLVNISNGVYSPSLTPTYVSVPVPAPPVPVAAPFPDELPHTTCQWVSQHGPTHICGAALPPDSKGVCAHFRHTHDVRGNDKVTADCHWYGCRAAPMQRGSVIRHVLAVHLGLLRWQCEVCGRVFSRRGTGHVCAGGEHA